MISEYIFEQNRILINRLEDVCKERFLKNRLSIREVLKSNGEKRYETEAGHWEMVSIFSERLRKFVEESYKTAMSINKKMIAKDEDALQMFLSDWDEAGETGCGKEIESNLFPEAAGYRDA